MIEPNDYPFIEEKPSAALVAIRLQNKKLETGINRITEPPTVSLIHKQIDTTYAHACKLVSKLEDIGYVESRKEGRKKYLELTDKGKEKAEEVDQLCNFTGSTEGLSA